MYFHYFEIISPWKRGGPFIWTNLNPFYPRMLSLIEIGPAVLEKKIFLISSMYFHYFVIISPWKRAGPSFEQTWIPFTQGCFVPSLVEIGPVVLETEDENVKSLQTDGQTDRRRTIGDQKTSLELSAKVS